jgi:hypothetical protein
VDLENIVLREVELPAPHFGVIALVPMRFMMPPAE